MSANLKLVGILLGIASVVTLAGPAQATETPPAPEVLTSTGSTGMVRLNPRTMKPIPGTTVRSSARTGSWGTSSRRGCGRAYVQNSKRNLLGSLAYRVRIYTSWCWNRREHRVARISTSQRVLYVSSQWRYLGLKSIMRRRYRPWGPAYPLAGYLHYRMLGFENCLLHYGCVGADYARQTLRVRSNGTTTWATDGDAR